MLKKVAAIGLSAALALSPLAAFAQTNQNAAPAAPAAAAPAASDAMPGQGAGEGEAEEAHRFPHDEAHPQEGRRAGRLRRLSRARNSAVRRGS